MFKPISSVSPRACAQAPQRATAALLQHCAGSISLEYAVLIGGIALGGALGLIGIGLALLDSFVAIRAGVLAPFP